MEEDYMNENKFEKRDVLRCPECGSTNIIRDPKHGELVCADCGLVISEHLIDQGPEWRAFTPDEKEARSRVGSPITLTVHDKGLSTIIDWRDKDAYGKKLTPSKRAQIYRLRKWQTRSRVYSSIERNLAVAMAELDRLASQLGVPKNVQEDAAMIYRKTIEQRLIRGRSIEAMIAAAVYAACRLRKVPRTLIEIASQSRVNRKELGRCYRLILRKLSLKIPIANPIDFIPKFGQELKLSGKTLEKAIEILQEAKKARITAGKDPTGLAAAAIYIAGLLTGEKRTQREIAEVAHVTEVTVRNRYKELVKRLKISLT
ncbi:MAG: transcription initiation factor IIB [Candidatus Asgardarchaeum sp.]|nr:transcription initiation factor IIB [Candidatus Odinarchaeota archaeon]